MQAELALTHLTKNLRRNAQFLPSNQQSNFLEAFLFPAKGGRSVVV
jgi:hypothetical protein